MYRDSIMILPNRMENQMEDNIDNETEFGDTIGGLYLNPEP